MKSSGTVKGRPRGSIKEIKFSPELTDEIMTLFVKDYSDQQIANHLKAKHNLVVSRGGVNKFRREKLMERRDIVIQNTDILKKIDISSEVDKLLRFNQWTGEIVMEIFENLKKEQLYDPKVLIKFIEAHQKSQGQIFALHGLDLTVKHNNNSDELSKSINEKLNRLVQEAPKETTEVQLITKIEIDSEDED